ncbi:MAG: hypothetical protein ACPGVB_06715 [Chitinophagales bacterium]
MKNLFLLLFLTALTSMIFAQTPAKTIELEVPVNDNQHINAEEWYQIHLDKPIKRIEEIYYDNEEKTPIKGEISPDRQGVILKNYSKRGRVKVRLIFEDSGNVVETISKSSCYIDPVIPM